MTLTRISYEDQQAMMDGRVTKEEALRRAYEACPECDGEMQDVEDRYAYGDGRWLVCEDCGYDVKL